MVCVQGLTNLFSLPRATLVILFNALLDWPDFELFFQAETSLLFLSDSLPAVCDMAIPQGLPHLPLHR